MANYFIDDNIGTQLIFRDAFSTAVASPVALDLAFGGYDGQAGINPTHGVQPYWQKLAGDSAVELSSLDNAANLPPKGARGVAAGAYSVYGPVAVNGTRYQCDYRWMSARGRLNVGNFTAGKFIGLGFVNAALIGIAAGWYTDGANRVVCIIRFDGATGARAVNVALTDAFGGFHFTREVMLQIRRTEDSGFLGGANRYTMYEEGQVIHAGNLPQAFADNPRETLYPCVVCFDAASAAVGFARLIEALYFAAYPFDSSAQLVLPMWKPIGTRDYVYEQTFDFAVSANYSLQMEATIDGSTRIRARTMVLSTYDATADATLTVDGVQLTIPVGREIVLRAPEKAAVDISGSTGQVRIRLYTARDYSVYQRD